MSRFWDAVLSETVGLSEVPGTKLVGEGFLEEVA